MENKFAEIVFNVFNLEFSPLNEYSDSNDSKSILKCCIDRINHERLENNKAIVIDRYKNRDDLENRVLFVSSAAYILDKNLYKCKLALIRDIKLPSIVDKTTYSLTPLDDLGGKGVAETTNFYIDMNYSTPKVLCEFNSIGPRVLDIEYYFRYISSYNMLGISKACKASIHMKMPINEVLDSIADVLKFRMSAIPSRLNYLYKDIDDSFITNMNGLANTINPKTIKVEAFLEKGGQNQIVNRETQKLCVSLKKHSRQLMKTVKLLMIFKTFTWSLKKLMELRVILI